MSDITKNTIDNAVLVWYAYSVVIGMQKENKLTRFKRQFEEISQWAKKYNVDVSLESGTDDRYESSEKKIFINSRLGAEARYYTLLHECGHLLVDKNWKTFERDNPMYASSCDLRIAKSKAYRVSIVAEEIEAWKRGRRLAKKLGHRVDDKKFDKMISENVMTYIDWAATGGGEL